MRGSEADYDNFNDHRDEIFQDYLNNDKVTDSEIVELILETPELFTAVVDAWCAKRINEEALRDWYLENLPDGKEEPND